MIQTCHLSVVKLVVDVLVSGLDAFNDVHRNLVYQQLLLLGQLRLLFQVLAQDLLLLLHPLHANYVLLLFLQQVLELLLQFE